MATMASADEKVEVVMADVNSLDDQLAPEKVKERANKIDERRNKNKEEAQLVTTLLQVGCQSSRTRTRLSAPIKPHHR